MNIKSVPIQVEKFLINEFPNGIRKVLLINPPDSDSDLFRVDTARRKRYTSYPPYGLMLLAKNIIDLNIDIEVKIVDLNLEQLKECNLSNTDSFNFDDNWRKKLDEVIKLSSPDFIIVTCMFSMTHNSLVNVCDYLQHFNTPISVGGVYVTENLQLVMKSLQFVNLFFINEGDVSITIFLKVINAKCNYHEIVQLVIRCYSEKLEFRFNREVSITDKILDKIPSYELINIDEYSLYGVIGAFYFLKDDSSKFATVLSNRGCRAHCTFCNVRSFYGNGVRKRNVIAIADEFQMLSEKYGINHIMWLDDDLLVNHKRAIELFNEIASRKLDLTWDATNGLIARSCTDEVIHAARKSGCIAVNIGVESGNNDILQRIRKPSKVNDFINAAKVLRKYESIHTSVFLMIGFPNETMGMIRDTIELARQMNMDWYRISQLQPLPNTPIYDAMIEQGIIKNSDNDEVRFNGGAFGKQNAIEQDLSETSVNKENLVDLISDDSIPTPEQLTEIWFYMNYHLNFKRLFGESNPEKIRQQILNLRSISDLIAPENGFALYFLGYLEYKTSGTINNDIINRLRVRLKESPYWREKFHIYGLNIQDLEQKNFNHHKEIS